MLSVGVVQTTYPTFINRSNDMQNNHVLEVAIFKVKPECVEDMVRLRAGLREALKGFSGLIEFCGYCPIDTGIYADIVDRKSVV